MIEEQEKIKIENMIYEIRGKQVMLDSDLAKLYQVETKRINESVNRNPDKFPERFSFLLELNEFKCFEVANCDFKSKSRGGRRYSPRVFTEQGVAMLATILKSRIATQISIQIMDAFVMMRKYISTNNYNQRISNIESKVIEHDKRIHLLQESFHKLEEKKKINEIYFNGQIYDAYSKIIDIMKEAKEKLIIIDSYADKTILDMVSKIKVNTTLITKANNKLTKLDIEKYNKQYHNLTIIYNNTFHDRYIIIDKNKIYHCGTSINYAGSKTFSINILEDEIVKNTLIDKIKEEIK